ncbi:MAG: S49 family peptidase [Deltaproteobacteria bacterium]|nr:S49 family peptidase [Deltaproteobacteria bacterium]
MRPWLPLLLALTAACDGRPRHLEESRDDGEVESPAGPQLAEINLRNGATERGGGGWLGGGSDSFSDLILEIRQLEDSADTRGLFVRFGTSTLGVARAEELGRSLARHRVARPVVCHADGYDNATLLAAAVGCSEVWLTPAGSVESVGIAAQLVFARALFDRLGVKVDFMQEGRFKGAEETFTRNEPSEPARKSLEAALLAIREAWVSGIEKGRDGKADALGLEDGPHPAADARDKRLVDRLGFEAEARDRALELSSVRARRVAFGSSRETSGGLSEVVRGLAGAPRLGVPHVTVLRATGAISMGGGGGLGSSDGISHRELAPTLRKLARDPLTHAVVLRLDSPGGSALASDLLWKEVMELRKAKPVVVSVGGMAASGGYYIASAATKVVAERSSILGSIGVVMGKLSVAEPLANVGVNVTAVPANPAAGARATYLSPFASWDDATRDKLRGSMTKTYRLFLERIAEGRGVEVAAIEPAAEGRIMGGEDARTRGLIDEIGGLLRAIELARELAPGGKELPSHVERAGSSWLDLVRGDAGGETSRAELERAARKTAQEAILAPLAVNGPLLEDLSAFAGLVAPLAGGDPLLAAPPFSMSLR